jgi:hypothetical protein
MRSLLVLLAGALIVLALGLATPALAQAESIEISHGANPTQDVALNITVSGTADGHHKLYVIVNTYGDSCATYPDFESGTHLAYGTTLSSGSYSKEYSYTPTQVGTYTICAYLDETESETPDVSSTESFTAAMPNGSASIEVSANPTQNVPLKIKVSGSSEVSRDLYVIVNTYGDSCATYPDFESGMHLAYGESLSAGSYSKEYSYTPTQTGTYTVCAYVDEDESATPDATGSDSFTAAMPNASVSLEISGNPTQDVPLTIKVSGSTEVSRNLYVIVNTYGDSCATYPDFESGTHLAYGEVLSAGSYSKEYSYTPTQTGSYTVCGYIDENESATPDATGSGGFTTAMPAGSLSFAISPSSTENGPVSVKVSGSTEVSRDLYVIVNSYGDPCASFPDFESGTHLAYGETLGAGTYEKSYTYTPNQTGTYTVCGYLSENESATPDATGSGSFTNITPQTRAAEAALAAEKAAREAERAAEVKKEQEAAAKEKYKEEAPAREAAEKAAEIAAAKARAHKISVKHLSVTPAAHARNSSFDPGYTNLDITTSPYAYVVVKLSRYGHTTEHLEWGGHSSEVAEVIRWSCKSPGGIYRYVVTAKSGVGPTLTRKGHFAPVSITRCHTLKQQEAEARERSEHEAAKEQSHVEREERERLETNEANCRAEGGTPRTLYVEGRAERYCIAPWGGFLPVPQ